MTSWADFEIRLSRASFLWIKGKMKTLTPSERMHRLPEEHYFPIAIVPSPTGKSLAWITEGDLWTWCMDSRERFIGDDGTMETRFGDRKVSDACMHEDGILEVLLEDGSTLGLFCDEEMLLQPFEDGWIPGRRCGGLESPGRIRIAGPIHGALWSAGRMKVENIMTAVCAASVLNRGLRSSKPVFSE